LPRLKNFCKKEKIVLMRGRGSSMNPLMREGRDAAVLSPVKSGELKIGDIVLFEYKERYILHRIIGKKGEKFVIQGDGVVRGKEIVEEKAILAVVRRIIRSNGKEVSVDSRSCRLYWALWRFFKPLRLPILLFLRKIWYPRFFVI